MKWILLYVFPAIILTSCITGKSVQRRMMGIQSELFYELTTPVCSESGDTVYLSPIDYSAILPYTTVKKKIRQIIPLLLFNLVQNKYEVELGENSFVKPYREFLMDALWAQCNRSSCFNLKVKDTAILPDTAFILEVKVNKNISTAKLLSNEGMFFNPFYDGYIQGFSNWEIKRRRSLLEISARLMQQGKCLWEKQYKVTLDLPDKRQYIENPDEAYKTCIDDMTECLSYATKGIVENISQYLQLQILQKQKIVK